MAALLQQVLSSGNSFGISLEVKVNHKSLVLELDTGPAISTVSEEVVTEKFPGASIQPSSELLKTYTGW